ncbi:MAG: hypothetical protein RIQ62_1545 [Bacteroidota bacterium]|jgi:hypothetical protein
MKTFIFSVVLMMLMPMAKSQPLSITMHAGEAVPVENTIGMSHTLCSNYIKQSGLESQNRFSNANYQPTNWKGVRRTGGILMLTGVGLTVIGGVTMAVSPSDNYIGISVGDLLGGVAVGGGVLTFFTGTIVTIIGTVGSATDSHGYGFQLQAKKEGVSLVYHF